MLALYQETDCNPITGKNDKHVIYSELFPVGPLLNAPKQPTLSWPQKIISAGKKSKLLQIWSSIKVFLILFHSSVTSTPQTFTFYII